MHSSRTDIFTPSEAANGSSHRFLWSSIYLDGDEDRAIASLSSISLALLADRTPAALTASSARYHSLSAKHVACCPICRESADNCYS